MGTAIVDTGTYLMYGPSEHVHRMLPHSLPNCDDYAAMPTRTFDFEDELRNVFSLSLKPQDYVVKFSANKNEECVIGLSPDRENVWTLGQAFLRSFYTLFDRERDRIGFANLPHTAITHLKNDERDKKMGNWGESPVQLMMMRANNTFGVTQNNTEVGPEPIE